MRARTAVLLIAFCFCGAAVRAQQTDANITEAVQGGAAVRAQQTDARITEAVQGMLSNMLGSREPTGAMATFANSAGEMKETLKNQFKTLGSQLEEQMKLYEDKFCVPAKFVPSEKVTATFTGHSFALTFDSGSCYFNETAYYVDGLKELNCTEPSIVFRSNPAAYTSAHHTAPVFTSQFCQISKAFGEPSEKVIYVFDGVKTEADMDMGGLAEQIAAEVQKMLATLTEGVQGLGAGNMWGGMGLGGLAGSS